MGPTLADLVLASYRGRSTLPVPAEAEAEREAEGSAQ